MSGYKTFVKVYCRLFSTFLETCYYKHLLLFTSPPQSINILDCTIFLSFLYFIGMNFNEFDMINSYVTMKYSNCYDYAIINVLLIKHSHVIPFEYKDISYTLSKYVDKSRLYYLVCKGCFHFGKRINHNFQTNITNQNYHMIFITFLIKHLRCSFFTSTSLTLDLF